MGFLGGFERWNDPHRGVRKLALDLRKQSLPNLYVETISNHRRTVAIKLLRQSLTTKRTRHARAALVPNVRVVLYGQSWGGGAAIDTARALKKLGIEVALTVQVDSVGLHDTGIPSNVRSAANLYQHDQLTIDGEQEIHPEDPSRTRILENTRLSYVDRSFDTLNKQDASWIRRGVGGSHAKMEADEAVWRHVEDLILSALIPPASVR